MTTQAGEKFLVVRVGRAGDMVMITPALRMLLDQYPRAVFHLMTSADGRRVLAGYHPRLTEVFLYTRRVPRTWWEGRRLVQQLRAQGYDGIFLFETNPHYHRLLARVGAPLHAIRNLKPDVHYCVRCLEVVEATLPKPPARGWINLPVTEEGRRKAGELLRRQDIHPEDFLVGLHCTYSGMTLPWYRRSRTAHRTWPQESFATLARNLREEGARRGLDLKVVTDVLPEERPLIRELEQKSGGALTVLCEPPDFERYKGVLARMNLFVTPDTGPMHIAAALGVPVVALFSGKSPLDCGPFISPKRYRILRAEDCAPPPARLSAITPAAVLAACLDLMPA